MKYTELIKLHELEDSPQLRSFYTSVVNNASLVIESALFHNLPPKTFPKLIEEELR